MAARNGDDPRSEVEARELVAGNLGLEAHGRAQVARERREPLVVGLPVAHGGRASDEDDLDVALQAGRGLDEEVRALERLEAANAQDDRRRPVGGRPRVDLPRRDRQPHHPHLLAGEPPRPDLSQQPFGRRGDEIGPPHSDPLQRGGGAEVARLRRARVAGRYRERRVEVHDERRGPAEREPEALGHPVGGLHDVEVEAEAARFDAAAQRMAEAGARLVRAGEPHLAAPVDVDAAVDPVARGLVRKAREHVHLVAARDEGRPDLGDVRADAVRSLRRVLDRDEEDPHRPPPLAEPTAIPASVSAPSSAGQPSAWRRPEAARRARPAA